VPVRRRTLLAAAALLLAGLVVLLAFSGPQPAGVGLASASQAASLPAGAQGASAGESLTGLIESSVPGSTPAATPVVTPGTALAVTPAPTPAATAVPTAAATPAPTPVPTVASTPGPVAPCPVFPSSNVWNRDISTLPVAANSATLISSIGLGANLHPDFSATGYGIPINVVGPSTPRVSVSFQYDDESDAGPYPIPANPAIEGGSDRHIILWDKTACMLYELYAAAKSGGSWQAGSGAIWNLRSNALRPDGWTSADAAGLPILPGLVRYSEVATGAIHHALRFTAPTTRTSHIYPARHDAGDSGSAALPPMGTRVRLKASVDISGFGPQSRVLLEALKRYGMILADNGSPWYVTGAPDPHWDDDELHALGQLSGADFEVVDVSSLP
jgi:hypothetical protein